MRLMKKPAAILVAGAIMLGFAIPASAAATYDVNITGNTVKITQGGQVTASYAASSSAITLTTDRDKDFLVQFTNRAGQRNAITLGDQKSLNISGDLDSLTVSSSLDSTIALNIAANTTVDQLIVYGKNNVAINGSVVALTQNAGSVTVQQGAKVEKARVTNANATLRAIGTVSGLEALSTATIMGNGVQKTYQLKNNSVLGVNDVLGSGTAAAAGTVKPAATPRPTARPTATPRPTARPTTSSGSKTVKLRIGVVDIDSGDRLSDAVDELNYVVTARDASTGADVSGTASWINSGSTEPKSTNFYRFRFTPDDSAYKVVTDQVKVRVGGDNTVDSDDKTVGSDRTITFKDSNQMKIDGSEENDSKTLSDVLSQLESTVTAYSRSEDEDLEGTFKWKKSGNTKIEDGKSYSYTFYPDDDDYKETSGSIKILYRQ